MAATKAKRSKAKAKAKTTPTVPKNTPASTGFGGGFAPFKES